MTQLNPQANPQGNSLGLANPLFTLEYPQSIGIYGTYAQAQKAVDFLADNNFPVRNLAIVGTDLKLVERVTGRKTWGTILSQGVMSGLSTALMIAFIFLVLSPSANVGSLFLTALAIGILIGVGFAVLGQVMSKGQRDFTSISQTIPSRFEILCEHKVSAQARDMLSRTADARAAAFDPKRFPGAPQQGYPGPQQYPQDPYAQAIPQPGAYPVQPSPYPAQAGGYPAQPGPYAAQPGYPAQPPFGGYPPPTAFPSEQQPADAAAPSAGAYGSGQPTTGGEAQPADAPAPTASESGDQDPEGSAFRRPLDTHPESGN